MPLGIDATIQYRVGSWRVLNGRAICASPAATTRARTAACRRRRSRIPGLASLNAAAHPAKVPYLYYVAIPGDRQAPAPLLAHLRRLPALPADAPGMTITGATRVACVIGDPVEHSRSPRMHNAAVRGARARPRLRGAAGRARRAGRGVRGLAALGLDGANVTLPHKAAVAALCDELGPEARDAGAVNTLTLRPRGGPARRSHRRPRAARGAAVGARAASCWSAPAGARARPPRRCCARARSSLTIVARRPEAAQELAARAGGARARGRGRGRRRRPRERRAVCSCTARPSAASPTSRGFPCLPM